MTDSQNALDMQPFNDLVGEDIFTYIVEHAPKKIMSRVSKALDHYNKSLLLQNVDDEMGAIRLIAGEEELVVAIFEWLKLNENLFPEHQDFVKKFKNHAVKLAFYPVLSQFRFIVTDIHESGITFEGFEGIIDWSYGIVVRPPEIKLTILDQEGETLIETNPQAISLSQGDIEDDAFVDQLLEELKKNIKDQQDLTLKQFVAALTEYRNRLLYAADGGYDVMEEPLENMMGHFNNTYRDLLWVIAVLLGSKPLAKNYGIASQFIALYRKVLEDIGMLMVSDN